MALKAWNRYDASIAFEHHLLVGWLELIFVRRMGIKSTILPPEGHVGRAELWIYSAAALP
jgi:hypothetical protein